MHDVMLDLETLGVQPGCVVLSIGAVFFDFEKGLLGQEFYRNIDRASSEQVGLKVEPDTEAWWAKQNAAARVALQADPQPVRNVVREFHQWFFRNGGVRVWSHGATFDIPLWDAVAKKVGEKNPWKYTTARDTRTAFDLWGFDYNNAKRSGTHHNALHDAKHQAAMLQLAYHSFWAKQSMAKPVLIEDIAG